MNLRSPRNKQRAHLTQYPIPIRDRLKQRPKRDTLPFSSTDSDRPIQMFTAIALFHRKAIAIKAIAAGIIIIGGGYSIGWPRSLHKREFRASEEAIAYTISVNKKTCFSF